ncbi:MAG: sugar transferase [Capsulimonadales bacterium]|nr:sugar transferase [Capsulimonadales bacterium]
MSITSFDRNQSQSNTPETAPSAMSGGVVPGSLTAVASPGALSLHPSPCGKTSNVRIGRHSIHLPVTLDPGPLYAPTKRAIDVFAAVALLIVLSPVFAVVALLIFLEDRGPVFYYQTRVGKDGQHFLFYKFRSMVTRADLIRHQLETQNEAVGPIFKMKNDPRITRVGRFIRRYSIDELPQLFNVLRGEMSLVGPRPHLPREVNYYTDPQKGRLAVQPGLLCLREILGRSNMTFEEWIELDLLYIRHRCLRTDLMILARTIPSILAADGAY